MNMNTKTLTTIGSILGVGTALTFYLINKIPLETFVTVSTTIVGVFYGIYQKFEAKDAKDEVVQTKLQLEDKNTELFNKDATIENMKHRLVQSTKVIEDLTKEKLAKPEPSPIVVEPVVEVQKKGRRTPKK